MGHPLFQAYLKYVDDEMADELQAWGGDAEAEQHIQSNYKPLTEDEFIRMLANMPTAERLVFEAELRQGYHTVMEMAVAECEESTRRRLMERFARHPNGLPLPRPRSEPADNSSSRS